MLHLWKKNHMAPPTQKLTDKVKPQIRMTADLISELCPGTPAVLLYNGKLIWTSTVQAILEESSELIRFETQNSIYSISSNTLPESSAA